MVGAVFIQYMIYGVLYIVEGIKNDESTEKEVNTSTAPPKPSANEEQKDGEEA